MNDLYEEPEVIPFQEVLDALLDVDTPLAARYLYRLTDLGHREQDQLSAIWPQLPTWRRTALLQDLDEMFEGDTLLSFEAISRLALQDSEAEIRFLAVRSLQEYEVPDLVDTFIRFMETDPDETVRAVAASALGKYIYQGEIEELPVGVLKRLEEHLLDILAGPAPKSVRRRALESLGFSSRKEVPAYIDQAFASQEQDWICSAVFAMGRSYDRRWQDIVLEMLDHSHPAVRMEAARAAGELELSQAIHRLAELVEDDDNDVRLAAIWSLSQIGGNKANRTLNKLVEESADEDEADFIASALDNLVFNESVGLHGMLDFSDEDEELDFDYDLDYDEDDEDDYSPIDYDAIADEDSYD